MNIILYVTIFLIGCMFGSFYTLAVYRIPKKEDITHTHSYCPNCYHKLGFFELIPILSYIFLGGKCKNCNQKIRIRYLILELLSGIVFLLFSLALKLDLKNFVWSDFVFFIFIILYLTLIILIGGTDKENRKIEIPILAYGIIISIIYVLYLYIIEKANILRYLLYLVAFAIMLVLDNMTLKHFRKNCYLNGILILIIIMAIFTGEYITINTIFVTILAIAIYLVIIKIKDKIYKTKKAEDMLKKEISIGYFLCISNGIIFLVMTWLLSQNI